MSKKKLLVIGIGVPLLVGAVSSFLTSDAMKEFANVKQPPLSPPSWLFPIVWTILYIFMGIASYLVYTSKEKSDIKIVALWFYAIQLFFNFWWSIIFFNMEAYLFAAIWLIILWMLIIVTTALFGQINHVARNLMIPYLLWVTFAVYLNLGVWILN